MAQSEKTPRIGGAGFGGIDLTGGAINPGNSANDLTRQRLNLFAVRCRQMVDRVNVGAVAFIEAVDLCSEAATWSGLMDDVGVDQVQAVMSTAFAEARRR
jgi:hypothetical protein